MLGWDQYEFNKKHTGTRYTELMFLHPMGSVGHIVHSGASELRNINTLFFMLRWDQYRFNKSTLGHVTSNFSFCIRWDLRVAYCIPVHPSHQTPTHYFSCSGGPSTDYLKSASRHITLNLCFCICWIYGSRCAFRCIRGVNHRCTIFHAWVGPVSFP
jgi:hypothetical protein